MPRSRRLDEQVRRSRTWVRALGCCLPAAVSSTCAGRGSSCVGQHARGLVRAAATPPAHPALTRRAALHAQAVHLLPAHGTFQRARRRQAACVPRHDAHAGYHTEPDPEIKVSTPLTAAARRRQAAGVPHHYAHAGHSAWAPCAGRACAAAAPAARQRGVLGAPGSWGHQCRWAGAGPASPGCRGPCRHLQVHCAPAGHSLLPGLLGTASMPVCGVDARIGQLCTNGSARGTWSSSQVATRRAW